MQKQTFQHNQLTFSYLDSGGDGPLLIALHAHWMEGITFASLAAALAPERRVVALDQRGHGHSDHAATYARGDYLGDLTAFFAHLKVKKPVVLLGNSLGGINSIHFAAHQSDLVRALIIEDIGVEISDDISFSLNWEGTFKTREDLAECIGSRLVPYLQDSFRQTDEGWQLAFNPRDMVTSVNLIRGNHWKEWLASDCPALLIRGQESLCTTQELFEQMAWRRSHTRLSVLEGGHVVHVDNPTGFTEVVTAFLQELKT